MWKFISDDGITLTAVAMIGRFMITYAANTGVQMYMEIFPTEVRGQAGALASTFGVFGELFGPFIVYSVWIE